MNEAQAIVDSKGRPLTGPELGYIFEQLLHLVATKEDADRVGSFTSFDDSLAGDTGTLTDFNAGDVRYFLSSGGLISNRDTLMKLAYNAMRIVDLSQADPIPILIDHWTFRRFPFATGRIPNKRNMQKPLRDLLQRAIRSGTAIIIVETKATGWENNPQVLNHYVCYAAFASQRLLQSPSKRGSCRPHIVKFETARAAGRQEWDLRQLKGSRGTVAPEDSKVIQGIAEAFEWEAKQMRKSQNDSVPAGHSGFYYHSLPAARQGTDRGCTVSAILNAHVVSSLRTDILKALDEAPSELVRYEAGATNMDELWDQVESCFNLVGWGPDAQIELCYNGPARRLYDDMYGNGRGPTIFDISLFELLSRAVFLAVHEHPNVWMTPSESVIHKLLQYKAHCARLKGILGISKQPLQLQYTHIDTTGSPDESSMLALQNEPRERRDNLAIPVSSAQVRPFHVEVDFSKCPSRPILRKILEVFSQRYEMVTRLVHVPSFHRMSTRLLETEFTSPLPSYRAFDLALCTAMAAFTLHLCNDLQVLQSFGMDITDKVRRTEQLESFTWAVLRACNWTEEPRLESVQAILYILPIIRSRGTDVTSTLQNLAHIILALGISDLPSEPRIPVKGEDVTDTFVAPWLQLADRHVARRVCWALIMRMCEAPQQSLIPLMSQLSRCDRPAHIPDDDLVGMAPVGSVPLTRYTGVSYIVQLYERVQVQQSYLVALAKRGVYGREKCDELLSLTEAVDAMDENLPDYFTVNTGVPEFQSVNEEGHVLSRILMERRALDIMRHGTVARQYHACLTIAEDDGGDEEDAPDVSDILESIKTVYHRSWSKFPKDRSLSSQIEPSLQFWPVSDGAAWGREEMLSWISLETPAIGQ